MADGIRERLLASFGDMGEAMVAQNVLDSGGVPCRVGDLAGLPSHLMGSLGGINRSVGIWVLEPDVERASAMLAAAEPGSGVDEEALAAEALAAAPPDHAPPQEPLASRSRRAWGARHSPGIGPRRARRRRLRRGDPARRARLRVSRPAPSRDTGRAFRRRSR